VHPFNEKDQPTQCNIIQLIPAFPFDLGVAMDRMNLIIELSIELWSLVWMFPIFHPVWTDSGII
jgi:hypothetical protein